jgi:hypothetical protein
VLLVFGAPGQLRLLAGQEHGRAIPLAEMIAKKIIEIAQTGVREPADISALAIKELGVQ